MRRRASVTDTSATGSNSAAKPMIAISSLGPRDTEAFPEPKHPEGRQHDTNGVVQAEQLEDTGPHAFPFRRRPDGPTP